MTKVVRVYQRDPVESQVLARGMDRDVAKAWCSDGATSGTDDKGREFMDCWFSEPGDDDWDDAR